MKKKDIIWHLKNRWEEIHKLEVAENKKLTVKDRFSQLTAIFELAKELQIDNNRFYLEPYAVMKRWNKLKTNCG